MGARVAALGAGPLPIPRSQLTADRLVQAIERAMDDQALRLRAAKLGRKIKAENGIGAAKEFIREYH